MLGAMPPPSRPVQSSIGQVPAFCPPCNDTVDKVIWGLIRAFAGGVCLWHGYERNSGSWGWALAWFLFGSWVPVVAVSVVCVQRYNGGEWPFPPSTLRGSPASAQ